MPAKASKGVIPQADPDVADDQVEAKAVPAIVPQPPPKPLPPRAMPEPQVQLPDLPCVYLHERAMWQEFKKNLHECGLIWGLPHWMTTIMYHGTEWQQISSVEDDGVNLDDYFPIVQKTAAGDGNSSNTSALGLKLVGLLGRPKSLTVSNTSVQFCCLTTVEYESDRKLPSRQKFWTWMVKSLRENNSKTPGPFHYLVDEVQMYDCSYLFKRLIDVLEQITICSLDDELENVIKMDYKPHSQNIFSYLGDLRKAIQRLHDINERLPEEGRIILPDSYVRSRLVRAARQVPIYKPVLDCLLTATVEEWSSITSEELYHQLEAVCANDQSVSAPKNAQATNFDSLSANTLQFKERSKEKEKKSQPPLCFQFSKGLGCSQNPYLKTKISKCKTKTNLDHVLNLVSTLVLNPLPTTIYIEYQSVLSVVVDTKKITAEEKKKLTLTWLASNWMATTFGQTCCVWKRRQQKKPSVSAPIFVPANAIATQNVFEKRKYFDGQDCSTSNVSFPPIEPAIVNTVSISSPPDGMVRETFLADTGASRSLHPNGRSAISFSRVSLEISTACVGQSMHSEGVGKMQLYTPSGKSVPGFDNVVFASKSARKLASVGELCDAGLVCVFDKDGLTTYEQKDVQVRGTCFTKDERDRKSRLYPLSLLRKKNERSSEILFTSSSPFLPERKTQPEAEKLLAYLLLWMASN